jgi:hypothetical protein
MTSHPASAARGECTRAAELQCSRKEQRRPGKGRRPRIYFGGSVTGGGAE